MIQRNQEWKATNSTGVRVTWVQSCPKEAVVLQQPIILDGDGIGVDACPSKA